jgi:hypothetical protein
LIPFLGVHSLQNDSAKNFDPGLRVGALLGARVGGAFSVGAEVALDVLNPSNVPSGVDVTALDYHIAFSPLYHLKNAAGTELVAGPKLGLFRLTEDVSGGGQSGSVSAYGLLYGLNVGVFGTLTETTSMGALLSFDLEDPNEVCSTLPGLPESCSSDNLQTLKVVALALALLF